MPTSERTAVITMVMKADLPHALLSIASLDGQLSPTTRHFVLLNDQQDGEIEAQLSAHAERDVICAERNIGVPAGRNLLLQAAIDWGAELIVVFDDDLIAPDDYLIQLTSAYRRIEAFGEPVGAIAPALLTYRFARAAVLSPKSRAALDHLETPVLESTKKWRRRLRKLDRTPDAGEIEHLGIQDWETHYLGVGKRAVRRWLSNQGVDLGDLAPHAETVLANVEAARSRTIEKAPDPIRVDTVPGGVWCVGREVLEQVGLVDEAFSPFGFEDAEWCIRATRAGYANYCVPDVLIAHDYQKRLADRSTESVFATRGRARAILLRKHGSAPKLLTQFGQAIVEPIDTHSLPQPEQATLAYFGSFIDALVGTEVGQSDVAPESRSRGTISWGRSNPVLDMRGSVTLPADVDISVQKVSLRSKEDLAEDVGLDVRYSIAPDRISLDELKVSWPDASQFVMKARLTRTAQHGPGSWTGFASLALSGEGALTRAVTLIAGDILPQEIASLFSQSDEPVGRLGEILTHLEAEACQGSVVIEVEMGTSEPRDSSSSVRISHVCDVSSPRKS